MDALVDHFEGDCIMSDSGDLKPGTLCYVKGWDPYGEGKVVEVIGPYLEPDQSWDEPVYEVWADWLNNGTWGEPKRGMPRRVLHPINPPGLATSLDTVSEA
jgi:hypothetical protein